MIICYFRYRTIGQYTVSWKIFNNISSYEDSSDLQVGVSVENLQLNVVSQKYSK